MPIPRVGRTALLTIVAVVWTFMLADGNWFSGGDWPLPVVQFLVPTLLGALPLANLVLAVRDARALQSGDDAQLGRWIVLVVATLINMFLLAIAFLFGAMLVNGPIAA